MSDIESLLQETINQLRDSLPQNAYRFINEIAFVSESEKDNTITLSVPSKFAFSNVSKQKVPIENTLSDKLNRDIKVNFIVVEGHKAPKDKESKPSATKKDDLVKNDPAPIKRRNQTLNKNYTLDNFICGDNSSLAYSAAKIVAKNPGLSYNPVLIYGGVGLGKTHLLQAIGNYIDDNDNNKNIIYVTAESFTNEFIASIGKTGNRDSVNSFKKKYRFADVLLIDDIHFLANKEATQEELFHIFNELYERKNQIVFTCDRPLTEIEGFTDRLKSRFTRGFNVDLRPPEYEVRVAIAQQKSIERGYNIPKETIEYICQVVQTNVRDLEGALTTVDAVSKIIGKPASIDIAKEHIKSIITPTTMKISEFSLDDVFSTTANYFNVSLVDMKGASRKNDIKAPRNIAIYIARKYGKFTLSEIGTYLNKDHTSISYTFSKAEPQINNDDNLQKSVSDILKKLNA